MPKTIVEYLKLENPDKYTSHSLRCTSGTMLADAKADIFSHKHHGGWKSYKVAVNDIEDC